MSHTSFPHISEFNPFFKHHVGILHSLTDCKSTRHYGQLNRFYKELFVSPYIVAKLIQRGVCLPPTCS